ncbi:hypothetical protein AD998_15445 [bacterium 336/3]|nr:hypothetical protein AD998_15445 [bacterium 336/3]
MKNNIKFNTESPKAIKEFLISQTAPWVYNPDEEYEKEYCQDFTSFFFLGKYKNKDVVFMVEFITLGIHYSITIDEKAEEEIKRLYPEYDGGDGKLPDNQMEAILEHKAQIKGKLIVEKNIKVREFIKFDDFGDDFAKEDPKVRLTVALNIDEVNEEEIDKFVKSFQNNMFKLDETLYSFRPIR